MEEICKNILKEEAMVNINLELLEYHSICERQITWNYINSKFMLMVDKMGYLEQSADLTDPSMMSHRQMPGAAIVIFLREQMGDPDDENAPKSDVIPVNKTGLNLGSIKNKVF